MSKDSNQSDSQKETVTQNPWPIKWIVVAVLVYIVLYNLFNFVFSG